MSLTKTYETKLIRTSYEVKIFKGTDVAGIKSDLAGVPDKATMVDGWDDEHGGVVMMFMLEKQEVAATDDCTA